MSRKRRHGDWWRQSTTGSHHAAAAESSFVSAVDVIADSASAQLADRFSDENPFGGPGRSTASNGELGGCKRHGKLGTASACVTNSRHRK
jgi:hypothetical protein